MSEIKISFGTDIFQGVGPSFVSIDQENIYSQNTLHRIERVTLSGRINRDSCDESGFSDPYEKKELLLSRLSKNFRKLSILETVENITSSIQEWDHAIVRSVSFDDNRWYDWIPYTIEFDCYKKGYALLHGVINPSRTVSIQTQPDNTVLVNVNCSCTGINNIEQGVQNARFFAYTYSFLQSSDILDSVSVNENIKNSLSYSRTINESINRLTGEVSVQRSYLIQESQLGFKRGVANFTRSLKVSENGETEVSIEGSIQGNFDSDTTMEILDEDFKGYDWYSIANDLYKYSIDDPLATPLFKAPTNFSLTRDPSSNVINFNLSFSNKLDNNIYIVDSSTITTDKETSIRCMETSISIRSNLKNVDARWDAVSNFYNYSYIGPSLGGETPSGSNLKPFKITDYMREKYTKYGYINPININVRKDSYSENRQLGTIDISAQFCTSFDFGTKCLQNINYTYNFVPALKEYKTGIGYEALGCHYVEDLNCLKRASFSIEGSAMQASCCSSDETIFQLKAKANTISNSLFPDSLVKSKILDISDINIKKPTGEVSFKFSWSAKKPLIIPPEYL